MSYTPTTWTTGDTITATKLNKIEQGIVDAGGGGVSGLCIDTNGTLDKSYNDLVAILAAGAIPYIFKNGAVYIFEFGDPGGIEANFFCAINSDGLMYVSSSLDDPLVLD